MQDAAMSTATIRDVARHAAVSVASASRALNGHASVAPSTRDRVIAAATALDYVPHLGARSLSTRRSNSIGVVLPDLFGEFFSEVIRGLDYAAHRRGLQLLLSNMHGATDETATAIRAMRGRVDGLIIMSPEADGAFLARHLPVGLPTVVLNGRGGDSGHAGIAIDGRAGAEAAARHLVAQGCTRLAHVRGPHGNADADDRAAAFCATIAALLPTPPRVIDGDFGEQSGIDAAEVILAERGPVCTTRRDTKRTVGKRWASNQSALCSSPSRVSFVVETRAMGMVTSTTALPIALRFNVNVPVASGKVP